MKILMYCLLALNVGVWLMYGIDKWKAKSGRWRIPEKVLLLAAFAGGSVGALAGMMMFRHKTKKAKFVISVPIIFCDPLCDSRICAFELLKNNVTVQPAPFVKPHCVLIVAAATVLLIKRR